MESSQAAKLCAIVFLVVLSVSASTGEPEVVGTNRVRRSDDDNLESLKTVVEQQAAVIQTQQAQLTSQQAQLTSQQAQLTSLLAQLTSQQAKLTSMQAKDTSLENNLQALQTKVNVSSSTVAFSARMSQDPVAIGPHQTLVFDHAITNVGNAYNTHTGIFTAPVAGTYAFFLSLMGSNDHSYVDLVISKNGAVLDLVFVDGTSDLDDQGSSLVSTHLVKGDQVWVHQRSGDTIRGSWYTVFTGYLLQAQ